MLRDYGAHVTTVTTHSSLLQNRNTDSKSHSLQKLKNKKCSSKDEIEGCRYFLQELLQRGEVCKTQQKRKNTTLGLQVHEMCQDCCADLHWCSSPISYSRRKLYFTVKWCHSGREGKDILFFLLLKIATLDKTSDNLF